jgi:hypothetical protein
MCGQEPETEQQRVFRDNYINERWKQLYSLEKESADLAIKYLLLTNSGGAVTVLSFIGTSEKARTSTGAIVTLSCFVVGIILVGIFNILRYYRISKLFYLWKHDVDKFYKKEFTWLNLTERDESRCKTPISLHVVGHLSFAAFLCGCIVGAISLFK